VIAQEETNVRRIVGRLERGESVLHAFEALAREHSIRAGFIRAHGALEAVSLTEYSQHEQRKLPERDFGQCELVSFEGTLSMHDGDVMATAHASVSRTTDNGIVLLGGELVSARAFYCEFVVECFDSISLERSRDSETGRKLWSGESTGRVRGAVEENSTETGSVTWEQIAALSATSQPREPEVEKKLTPRTAQISDDELFDEPIPGVGDMIEHRQFGRCRVDREDDEGGLTLRLPNGVRKVIKIDFFSVELRFDGEEKIYVLRPRKSRR
jgi:predicted DNA-binding protein with PD1-like motif